jgi:putative flippase GtrA|tara:strand:+ start:4814 stop:5188 length:375 start_codon:yes stop_codon:yes gene_type:complete
MSLNKIMKFIISGTFNSILNISVVFILINLSLNPFLASVSGFLSGAVSGYFLNFFWTFRNKKDLVKKLVKYIFLQLGTLLLGISIFALMLMTLSFDPVLSQFIAIFFTAMINFIISNYFIFDKT